MAVDENNNRGDLDKEVRTRNEFGNKKSKTTGCSVEKQEQEQEQNCFITFHFPRFGGNIVTDSEKTGKTHI